jgi:hypothetical protein
MLNTTIMNDKNDVKDIIEVKDEEKNENDELPITTYNPKFIKLKIQYNAFIRALKKKDFTTAYMLAKALRVSPDTINLWSKTPKAIKIMQEDINYYVSRIKTARDWKASAYLLDKITNAEDKDNPTSLLIGLSININPSKK